MRRQLFGVFLLALALLADNKIILSQSRPLSLPQLVAAAGAIFSGKVINVWSARDPAAGFIVTCSTIAVQDAVRGVSGSRFTFKQYGGSYGGLNVFLADMSYFFEGEEIVAFLYPASVLGLTSPVGTTEGKFLIRRDSKTGNKIVLDNLIHTQMLAPFIGKSSLPDAATATTAPIMEYEKFIAIVRDLAQRHLQ